MPLHRLEERLTRLRSERANDSQVVRRAERAALIFGPTSRFLSVSFMYELSFYSAMMGSVTRPSVFVKKLGNKFVRGDFGCSNNGEMALRWLISFSQQAIFNVLNPVTCAFF